MSYELISTVEVGAGGAASIEFTGVPDDGTDLVILYSLRSDTSQTVVNARFNSDSGASYYHRTLSGDGSSATSNFTSGDTAVFVGRMPTSSYTANTFSNQALYISNYASSSDKSISANSVSEQNATTAYQVMQAIRYATSSAISTVTLYGLSGNLAQYSTASLYKITAGDSGQLAQPKATGGTVGFAGGYWYHTFTSSGTFTPTEALTCDYLVVAGGGGGGNARYSGGGGGGAGGYAAVAESAFTATGYSVVVGAGGAGGNGTTGAGSQGSTSSFKGTSVTGGGGGGGRQSSNTLVNATSGGSGGGGHQFDGLGASGTGGQGNSGGRGYDSGDSTGGGGGASASGSNGNIGSPYKSGNGGNGNTWSNGTAYAGGGGGGKVLSSSKPGNAGSGGTGGGGDGGASGQTGNAGTANTGGGGGGGGSFQSFTEYNGGAGGSGVVIVRYAA